MVSVCLPCDASHNTYRLTWVSLTLDLGYLFTAVPESAAAAPYLGRGVFYNWWYQWWKVETYLSFSYVVQHGIEKGCSWSQELVQRRNNENKFH